MGLLPPLPLLLTFTLLSSWRVVDAQRSFTIRDMDLSFEPSADVLRDTNVTVRCQATVSSSGQETLSREYTIYKDGNIIYTKTTSTSEALLYPLPQARVSNSGKYKCTVNIEGEQRASGAKKLTVTGLSKPILHLNKDVVSEGEELTAMCTAPNETGSIFFYFYEDSTEIKDMKVNSNYAEAKLSFKSIGYHKIHCDYTVLVTPESFKSVVSNIFTVSVKELSITPVLEMSPQSKIYEGDQLVIRCTIKNYVHTSETMHLYLSQGDKLLSSGSTKVNHTMVALAQDPGEFECRLDMRMGNIVKVATKAISVTELFSVPTLTMTPAEVFQREDMRLTCKSDSYASERIRREEITYTLEPLMPRDTGVFLGKALPYEFNYTCVAQAKGIEKHSKTLTVHPKVSVSIPKISVVGRAVLGRPFKILCQSDTGTFPIQYTLWKDYQSQNTTLVRHYNQQALFTVSISNPSDINKFMCEANNSKREVPLGRKLNASVIVPLSNPSLTVIPNLPEISEGDHLILICGVTGTPPVTFSWYRVGDRKPLDAVTSNSNNTSYQVPMLSKEHSGKYYCEAVNYANNVVQSQPVNIEVRMALWKKALIGGFCLLAVAVLAVVCVLCYKSKRVKVDRAAVSVWTKGPPEDANDEESSVESNEPDVEYTEVVHPRAVDPARVPLRKGTDTVYSELQNDSPHDAADHHDYGSVEYAELNGEQADISHYHPAVNSYQDLPVPVD